MCILKKKTASEVVKAFESVLLESQIPEKLQTDEGKEFFNQSFQTLMKKHGIVHFATASDLKASVVERFNRTLKTRMWRYFTAHNTRHYLEVQPDLINSYNRSYHRSIKMTPMEVTSENADQVFCNLYLYLYLVRISKLRGVFDKKYEQSFTDEVFTVTRSIPRAPPVYTLQDYDSEPIKGSFYEAELQKVKMTGDRMFHVEKI